MAGIRVSHSIGDLADDLTTIVRRASGDMRRTVSGGIRAGNEVAKGYAKTSNGARSASRKYPGKFSAEMGGGFRGASVSIYSGEYGPRHEGQGMLAGILENGAPGAANVPQNNLRRSADIIGPSFAREVGTLPDRWFWPR